MTGRTKRTGRRSGPTLEGLESRLLLTAHAYDLHGNPIPDKNVLHYFTQLKNDVPLAGRQVQYTTPQGTKVGVKLFGLGTLAGTTVAADGSLNLVYAGTNTSSKIVGHTSGGTGFAPLASIRDVAVAARSATATGSEAINVVNLKKFDLVDGGYINIEGGVGTLALASMGQDSQIHVTGMTTTAPPNFPGTSNASNTGGAFPSASGVTTTAPNLTGGVATTGVSTTTSNLQGGGGGGGISSGNTTNAAGSTVTSNGTSVPVTSTTTTSGTTTTSLGTSAVGTTATTTGAGGSTSVGAGSVATVAGGTSTTATVVPGADISITHVNGASRTTPLGDPEIFGYDPTAAALVRFDATTGAALQSIPVPALGAAMAGVGLGRNNGRLVALVGSGTTIEAFDAITGAAVGSFSTASLAANGLTTINGIGSNDALTYVSDATAQTYGLIQEIDVTASLATGQAVAVGSTFAPNRQFQINGDLTGVAGADTIYSAGAATFDQFQTNMTQLGITGFTSIAGLTPVETSRNAVLSIEGQPIDIGVPGVPLSQPTSALGSVGPYLALDTGIVDGKNSVRLLAPSNLATGGFVELDDANSLTGLSESFHPELLNAALVDVGGQLRRFVADQATGLVLTSTAAVNLVKIKSATDTAIVGEPLNHVDITSRQNVSLQSTARGPRGTSTRNGVAIDKVIAPFGSITLP